jgi:hypothetical protein
MASINLKNNASRCLNRLIFDQVTLQGQGVCSVGCRSSIADCVRIGEAETHSGHFTRLIGESSFRDYLDLFKFRFLNAKKSCHLVDLIRTDEVRGLRAESLYTGFKLAALHCFRDVQADAAGAVLGAKQAEVTNNHFTSHLILICSLTTLQHTRDHASVPGRNSRLRSNVSAANHQLRMSMHHSPYAIRE